MAQVPLGHLAFARSGDKGDISDLSVFAPDQATYDLLADQLTAAHVKEHLGALVDGEVTRYEVPNILALKFVCAGALGGGGPSSLRADNLGKALGGAILRVPVEVDESVQTAAGERPRPPRDPYSGASWVVEPRR
jgi:hypothetical protein